MIPARKGWKPSSSRHLPGFVLTLHPANAISVSRVLPMATRATSRAIPNDYDRVYALDLAKLLEFLQLTQPETVEQLGLVEDGPARQQFLARLQGEIAKRGVIDVLRKGIKHGPPRSIFSTARPRRETPRPRERFAANLFSVTRQLRYSRDETQLALDLALFINGLPDRDLRAEEQPHQADRRGRRRAVQARPRSARAALRVRPLRRPLRRGRPGGPLLHRSLRARRRGSCPFNKGWNDGAGNPPNPDGLKTDYLWQRDPHARGPDRHPRELRPDRRGRERQDRQEDG